ncbi:hypothetical protein G6F22_021170 [Rhizopus arrhizus]|nr:hypothetical protein G6F22_021170 [Rhizopus arrhizus]KAG1244241.1 hypothetical protein G6F65_021922 [Rhizopus arrhizus]
MRDANWRLMASAAAARDAMNASTSGFAGRCSGNTTLTRNGNERRIGRMCRPRPAKSSAVSGFTMARPSPWRTNVHTDTAVGVSTMDRRSTPASAKASSIWIR